MYCKNCGKENTDDAVFCCRCGKPIQEKESGSQPSNVIVVRKKSSLAVIGSVFVIGIIGIVILCCAFFVYAGKQGGGKDAYACQLLSTLLKQNFGENAAQCKSFTVTTTPEWGIWFPELGVIKGGEDIGTAVLTNGTIMHDVTHDYRSGEHEIRVQSWGPLENYLME